MLVLGDTVGNNLSGTSGDDTIEGFAGNDTISGGSGNDLLFGNQDNDQITAGDGLNTVYGGMGNDLITAGNGANILYGDEGSDTIRAGNGGNFIVGGTNSGQNDSLDGADFIVSGSGNDSILGNGGNDTIASGLGNDLVFGGFGDDVILGQQGNDLILGNQGNDVLYGGMGDDTLFGGMGDDTLYGNEGNNLIIGNEGNDTAVFAGSRSSYLVTLNQDGTYGVTNGNGVNTVSGVETFKFDDDSGDPNKFLSDQGGNPSPTPTPSPTPLRANNDDPLVIYDVTGEPGFFNISYVSVFSNDDPNQNLMFNSIAHFTATSDDANEGGDPPVATPTDPAYNSYASYLIGSSGDSDPYAEVDIHDDGTVYLSTNSDAPYDLQFSFDYKSTNGSAVSNQAHVAAQGGIFIA